MVRPDVLQAGIGGARRLEHPLAASAVENVGGMYCHREQEAFDIHQDMPFASGDFLMPVIAADAAHQGTTPADYQ